ncbi:DUF1572 domain-containing protein [Stieleria sp. JC731]|uniref:DUF1572 family protein n=1 Tax=Pirellulaceae TaxID=2691357 RepID=UPI001E42E16C|nr:DUF1572 family protein [Stieleria sp. JC731]MCC9603721.1 DUF1572 domain-containing protein [Stieleria sp. JC731]
MDELATTVWIDVVREAVASYRRMIDATVEQLSDEELFCRPETGINSVAVILRHLGGNLQSRWTDFLTSDGEKPDRDREAEFVDWEGDRASLLEHFDLGWDALVNALDTIDEHNVGTTIYIRGEAHSIPQAIMRSVAHLTYHVGQVCLIARIVHRGDWQWLTIAPGSSAEHNARTWGSEASRSIFSGRDKSERPRN